MKPPQIVLMLSKVGRLGGTTSLITILHEDDVKESVVTVRFMSRAFGFESAAQSIFVVINGYL